MLSISDNKNKNKEIITRYTDQPIVIPAETKNRIETAWGGEPIQLYAMADIDSSMNLTSTWLALGSEHIAIACEDTDPEKNGMITFERSKIKEIRETHGLSCTVLTILGSPDEPALGILRYTHRQRRAVENVKFVLEQQLKDRVIELDDSEDDIYATAVAGSVRDAQASVNPSKLSVIWRLIGYLKPYRKRVVIGLIASVFITLLELVPPFLTGSMLIDRIIKPFQAGLLDGRLAMNQAWILIGILAGIYVIREFCIWVRLRTMAMVGEFVARDLRDDLYSHIQKLSLSYFSKKQTGSIISRVSSDTDRLWDFIAFGIVEVSLSSIMLVGLACVLIYLDFWLGLVMVLPIPIFILSLFYHGSRMKRIFLLAWRKWSNMTDVLSDTIPGMRVVKAFNQEDYERKRFGKRNLDCLNTFNDIHSVWTSFWPLFIFGFHVLVVTVWVLALPRVLSTGSNAMTVGTFVSFLLYMGMFMAPLEIVGQMTRMLNRSVSSAHRVFEVMDTEPKILDIETPVKLDPVGGKVVFDNVIFAYDGIRQIIKGISFEVKPGEMIGLVGPSGAGKSTITNLIARFHDVNSGRILIDDIEISRLDTGDYRRQIGMVLQEPFLFHGTILDNIRYGVPGAGIEKVIEAARIANAHDFICKLPHGYDTVVGERGHTLSGGERQRVSIARAVMCDPRILILDEATSSVDTESERKIQEALGRLISGRTVFAIAHRLSTLRRATRLLVIEDGRITEEGTHDQLLAREDGTYKKFYDMQQELHEIYAL